MDQLRRTSWWARVTFRCWLSAPMTYAATLSECDASTASFLRMRRKATPQARQPPRLGKRGPCASPARAPRPRHGHLEAGLPLPNGVRIGEVTPRLEAPTACRFSLLTAVVARPSLQLEGAATGLSTLQACYPRFVTHEGISLRCPRVQTVREGHRRLRAIGGSDPPTVGSACCGRPWCSVW